MMNLDKLADRLLYAFAFTTFGILLGALAYEIRDLIL